MKITPKEIGKIFTKAREKLNLSIDQAYVESRIHPNVIKDLENGVFDRIGKVYIKSFIKKYSIFLKLDPAEMLEKYGAIENALPAREFDLSLPEENEQKEDLLEHLLNNTRVKTVLVAVLSCVLIILLFVLAGTLRTKFSGKVNRKTVPVTMPAGKIQQKEIKQQPSAPAAAKPAAKKETPALAVKEQPAPRKQSGKSLPVELALKARAEVWIQVTDVDSGSMVYAGILREGETKTLKGTGTMNVWTGKGDMLYFTVNGRNCGKVASGVVKNIEVSAEGIKVGDEWVARLK